MSFPTFFAVFFTSVATYGTFRWWLERQARTAQVRRLAARQSSAGAARSSPALMQVADEVRGRLASRLLGRLRLKASTEQLLDSAGIKWGPVGLIHRSAWMFLAAFAAVTITTRNQKPLFALVVAVLIGSLPILYVRRQSRGRVRRFEEQFPDCLEFVSRSMRAGHAFSVSLEMVSHEFAEPLAGEFRRIYEEQNLGQPLEVVLKKLSSRISSMDVHFFVSAVLLQKRTGGNLAELLDKLANIIRERFKLRARVRAISAQGLMSGRILASIPLAVAGLMFVVNPQYARFFVEDPIGNQLVAGAVGLEVLGYVIIRKLVVIEV
jgi:tight adherence protein B